MTIRFAMKKIETIEEAHGIILEIAKEFHRICVKHNIPYYMGYGTMLGAVRHRGFIPWDDDMDFLVHRKDFEKLQKVLNSSLPAYYKLRTRKDNIGIYGEILKIEDSRTAITELTNQQHANQYGLFIDIFPLDVAKNNTLVPFSRNWIISRLFQCEHNKAVKYRMAKTLVGGVNRIKYVVAKRGNYFVEYNGMDCRKTAMLKEVYGSPVLYKFEGTELYGVKDAHTYLTNLYGDYMQLPKEDERHTHILEMNKLL